MTYSYSDYNGCYNIEGDPIGHGVALSVVCCLEDRYFHHLEVNYHHYKFHLLTTLAPFLIRFYLFSKVLLLVRHLHCYSHKSAACLNWSRFWGSFMTTELRIEGFNPCSVIASLIAGSRVLFDK